MMQDFGLVSIITPSWACGKYIGETIRSVLAQTYSNWELLIQDDGSVDDTESIVARFAATDSRVKYERNARNLGAAESRNNALRRAKGRWIAFLDADDLWLPEKLERQLEFMVDNGYAFTYHEYSEINEDGKDLGVLVSGKKRVSKFDMFSCCWPGCLTVMYDADKIGLVNIRNIRSNNDTALWLKVVKKVPCHLLGENLAIYRCRDKSLTPKTLFGRIWAHYPLFRIAEGMNPLHATFWVIMNVFGNTYKKIFYIKRS